MDRTAMLSTTTDRRQCGTPRVKIACFIMGNFRSVTPFNGNASTYCTALGNRLGSGGHFGPVNQANCCTLLEEEAKLVEEFWKQKIIGCTICTDSLAESLVKSLHFAATLARKLCCTSLEASHS